jgi:hypothetical protein
MSRKRTAKSKPAAKRARARSKAVATDAAKMTHPQLTARFNELVPVANKRGIAWAKIHTSAFERKALGPRMIAKLEEAIAAAG